MQMPNLHSTLRSLRPRLHTSVSAFSESLGLKYTGEARALGLRVTVWSLSAEDVVERGWENVELISYASLWNLANLRDSQTQRWRTESGRSTH